MLRWFLALLARPAALLRAVALALWRAAQRARVLPGAWSAPRSLKPAPRQRVARPAMGAGDASSTALTPALPEPTPLPRWLSVLARFRCDRCGTTAYSTGEIRTCSNVLAKVLNVQNRRFVTVTCEGCGAFLSCRCVECVARVLTGG